MSAAILGAFSTKLGVKMIAAGISGAFFVRPMSRSEKIASAWLLIMHDVARGR